MKKTMKRMMKHEAMESPAKERREERGGKHSGKETAASERREEAGMRDRYSKRKK